MIVPVDQGALRSRLYGEFKSGSALSAAAGRLEADGFRCEKSKVDWAKDHVNCGCSRYSGGSLQATIPYPGFDYINVELVAEYRGEKLFGYRIFGSGKAAYGRE